MIKYLKINKFKKYLLKKNWFRKFNSLKKILTFQVIANFNKSIGKTYIPDPRNNINIETTSLCNLKCKFCAYDKKDELSHPTKTMTVPEFKEVLNQCINEKFKYIGLSPTTGDIFMDKTIFEKLDILEKEEKILGFYFYTNFIPIKANLISKLYSYKKIKLLGLSIYGDDLQSFKNFANSSDNAYFTLVKNLKELNKVTRDQKDNIHITIAHRTRKDYNLKESNSEVSNEIKELIKVKNIDYTETDEFNNWGGLIEEKNISDLNINFNKKSTKKVGACSLIFSRNIIGSNFDLNACACRDANFTLKLGNLKTKGLGELLSKKNSVYVKLIEDQNKGDFPPVCKTCDFYQSIYTPQPNKLRQFPESYTNKLEDFYRIIN